MEELALVTLLAETSQPVFAHHRAVAPDVTEWTIDALAAVSSHVESADRGNGLCMDKKGDTLDGFLSCGNVNCYQVKLKI